uniref:Guided entry of tail-anchored proteins factor 1 n=1 Tax=Canis lupus familiaris TaxID=9615 RepID=A0A8C0PDW7_CANLF
MSPQLRQPAAGHHLVATAVSGPWAPCSECQYPQMSRLLQKDAEQEAQMRAEIQDMKQELSTVNMMDEFARYARLERKINKMTDKLKTHVKARTAQLAKIKWVISVAFYILQAALMVSLIWKYYSVPVAVVPSKWITPLDRLVAFPTRVAASLLRTVHLSAVWSCAPTPSCDSCPGSRRLHMPFLYPWPLDRCSGCFPVARLSRSTHPYAALCVFLRSLVLEVPPASILALGRPA